MGWRLIYTRTAVRDLEDLVRYIASDRPAAAGRLGVELVELTERLVVFPYRGIALRNRPGVRRIVHAPYVLLYRLDEQAGVVRVLRFWHASRDPRSMLGD